jgi:hypothetical protein
MHAVIPYFEGRNFGDNNEYILCHVRAVDHKQDIQESGFKNCFGDQKGVDFYKLFSFLHNYTTVQPE